MLLKYLIVSIAVAYFAPKIMTRVQSALRYKFAGYDFSNYAPLINCVVRGSIWVVLTSVLS